MKNAIISNGPAFVAGSNIDPQLGIDVGATVKDYMRDKRIEAILAGNCLAQMNAEDNGVVIDEPQSDKVDAAFAPTLPEGCTMDDIIPGTDWTYGDAFDAIAEREQDIRAGNRYLYN